MYTKREILNKFNENILEYLHHTTDELEYTASYIDDFLKMYGITYEDFRRIFLNASCGEGEVYLDFFKESIDADKREEEYISEVTGRGDLCSDIGILNLLNVENTKTCPPSEDA